MQCLICVYEVSGLQTKDGRMADVYVPIDPSHSHHSRWALPIPRTYHTVLPDMEISLLSDCRDCPNKGSLDLESTMYFVHVDCWKLANESGTKQTTLACVYRLAKSVYPVVGLEDIVPRQ
jgi:hypothetical protein